MKKSFERWINWRRNKFSPEKVLEASGFSIEQIKNLRDYFAAQAHFIDPIGSWYPLTRLVTADKKERLKGQALLAQDYYEIIGILNFFLKELTGEEQPEPDDIVDGRKGRWKEEFYGKKFTYSNPDIQKKIILDYLQATLPKVVLLVEGDSEEITIRILFDAYIVPLEYTGISIHNFEGTGGISLFNVGAVLQVSKSQGIGNYLIIDNDENASKLVADLCGYKLLGDNCYRIWKKNFEEDNFGVEAVLETVNQKLQAHGLGIIDGEELRQEMERHAQKKLWKCLRDIYWSKYNVELDKIISKTELARTLSTKRANEIRMEIKNNSYQPRWEIEKEIDKIYKMFCS